MIIIVSPFSTGEGRKQEIQTVERLIKRGEYEEALSVIEEVIGNLIHENQQEDKIQFNLFKTEIFIHQGKYKEALGIVKILDGQVENIGSCLLQLNVITAYADILYYLGNFSEGIEKIEEGDNLLGELYRSSQPKCTKEHAALYKVKGKILEKLGKEEQALTAYEESLKLFQDIEDQTGISSVFNNLGIIYRKQGDLNQALNYYQKSLAIRRTLDNKIDIVATLNNMGIIYMFQGNLNKALNHYQDALVILEEIGHKQYIAAITNNLGNIFFDKGELDTAFNHYQRSLTLWGELGHQQYNAYGINHLGKIHRRKGELNKALAHYQQALRILEAIGNKLDISITLFDLFSTALDKNDQHLAKEYLETLKQIKEQENNKVIDQRYRVAKALYLKSDERSRMRARAEEMLIQVIDEEIIDHEITEYAMLNLCELYIENLKLTNDKTVLTKVQALVLRLLDVAKEQHSHWLIAEAYFLHAKLFLLDLNIEKSREFLGQAQIIAEEKGMKHLAMRISYEHDLLLQKIPKFVELGEKKAPLAERLEFANLEQIVKRLTQMRLLELPELKEEEPVLVLVMAENGLSLFSKPFLPEGDINPQLFGGFLSAIHSFSEAVFSRTLDRALLGEYTLVMKSEDPLLMCYICKGQAFSALQKLNQFIQHTVRSDKHWNALTHVSQTGKTLGESDYESLDQLANTIFSHKNDE
jgi:tetratricopeptide (TPR) repeat protein